MSEAYQLYIFETLIQSNGSMPINSLWSCISARFPKSVEFVSVIGSSASEFEEFLIKQPSLFRVINHSVALFDSSSVFTNNNFGTIPSLTANLPSFLDKKKSITIKDSIPSSHSGSSTHSANGYSDFELETEAVKFFQAHLLKRQERWVPIKSLAGHLSQASSKVRMAVGPQSEFTNFLHRHPLVFEVQGELASLRDDFKNACFMASSSHNAAILNLKKKRKERPQSMRIPSVIRRGTFPSAGVSDYLNVQAVSMKSNNVAPPSAVSAFTSRSFGNTVALSSSEYKAVVWLRQTIIKQTQKSKVSFIMQQLISAPSVIRNAIGSTQIELIEFVRKHGSLFSLDEVSQYIELCSTNNINLLIMGNRSQDNNCFTLTRQKGCVFCVTKLWGIIDLGFHEHVFFDRSLFKHVTDLTKHFKVGEPLYFNAVLAPKESRAKWRATQVWKEADNVAEQLLTGLPCTRHVRSDSIGEAPPSAMRQRDGGVLETTSSNETSSQLNDDPDSGVDNQEDGGMRQSREADAVVAVTDELHQMLSEAGVSLTEADDLCAAFASVRVAEAWEINNFAAHAAAVESADTANGGHDNGSDGGGNDVVPVTHCSVDEAVKAAVVDAYYGDVLGMDEVADDGLDAPGSVVGIRGPGNMSPLSSSPLSELNTMSGIPSIVGPPSCTTSEPAKATPTYCAQVVDRGPNTTTVPHDHNQLHNQQPRRGSSHSSTSTSSMSNAATQTLFTGDIMATQLFHDDMSKLV